MNLPGAAIPTSLDNLNRGADMGNKISRGVCRICRRVGRVQPKWRELSGRPRPRHEESAGSAASRFRCSTTAAPAITIKEPRRRPGELKLAPAAPRRLPRWRSQRFAAFRFGPALSTNAYTTAEGEVCSRPVSTCDQGVPLNRW